jgi:Na+-driven multidrug efflux pump
MRFSRPPTSFEWSLAVYLIAALMIGFGVIGLVAAHRAAPDKAEAALALEHRALWTLGIGCAVALLFWIFRRLTN